MTVRSSVIESPLERAFQESVRAPVGHTQRPVEIETDGVVLDHFARILGLGP